MGEGISQDVDTEKIYSQTDARFVKINDHQISDDADDNVKFAQEQLECPIFKSFWSLGNDKRKNFYVDSGLLYHKETLWGLQLSIYA